METLNIETQSQINSVAKTVKFQHWKSTRYKMNNGIFSITTQNVCTEKLITREMVPLGTL